MQVEFRHRSGRVILQVAVDVAEPCGRKRERRALDDDLMSTSYTHTTNMSILSSMQFGIHSAGNCVHVAFRNCIWGLFDSSDSVPKKLRQCCSTSLKKNGNSPIKF